MSLPSLQFQQVDPPKNCIFFSFEPFVYLNYHKFTHLGTRVFTKVKFLTQLQQKCATRQGGKKNLFFEH